MGSNPDRYNRGRHHRDGVDCNSSHHCNSDASDIYPGGGDARDDDDHDSRLRRRNACGTSNIGNSVSANPILVCRNIVEEYHGSHACNRRFWSSNCCNFYDCGYHSHRSDGVVRVSAMTFFSATDFLFIFLATL